MKNQKFIELEEINTSVAEDKFVELLQNKQTFFLNGSWGSGKTEFLNKVRKKSNKDFVDLNLWELKDERTVIHLGVYELFKKFYWFIRIFIVLCVIATVLATPAINLGLEKYLPKLLINFFLIIALIVTTVQFLKIKSDHLFYSLLKCQRINFILKNKVLIIDDFDRVSEDKQLEAYKLFNILNNRLPIIFVGDINKIYKGEGTYLQKIINQKIELPYVLHSDKLWINYFEVLEETFNEDISCTLVDVFIIEKRNLRDRDQFNNLVNQELILRKKEKHVQLEQQLVIIYVYLFYPMQYYELLKGYPLKKESSKEIFDRFNTLLAENDYYPPTFSENKDAYFISESVNNMTEGEIKKNLYDSQNMQEYILAHGDFEDDLYKYLIKKSSELEEDKLNEIMEASISNGLSGKYNSLIISMISMKKTEIFMMTHTSRDEIDKKIYNIWLEIIDKIECDKSQKLQFLVKNDIFTFKQLADLIVGKIDIYSEEYKQQKEKIYYLMTYLSAKNLWMEFTKWEDNLWDVLDELYEENPDDYIIFFRHNRIISAYDSNPDFVSSIPINKKYKLHTKLKSSENTNQELDGVEETVKRIEPKLKDLESVGYTFEVIK